MASGGSKVKFEARWLLAKNHPHLSNFLSFKSPLPLFRLNFNKSALVTFRALASPWVSGKTTDCGIRPGEGRKGSVWLSLALPLALLISGCQIPGLRLKELIAERKFNEAAQHYAEHKEFFKEAWSDYAQQLRTVAESLNQLHQPSLLLAIDTLKNQAWPTGEAEWGLVRKAIENATQLLSTYDSYDLLGEPAFRSPLVLSLRRLRSDFVQKVESSAPELFAKFDHFGEQSFFGKFPVRFNPKAFMSENFRALQPKLESASTTDLQQFLKLYMGIQLRGEVLDMVAYTEISNQYVRAYLGENSQGESPTLSTMVAALSSAKDRGLTPNSIPGVSIGFIEAKESTRKDGNIEIPLQLEVDIPATTIQESVKTVLSDPRGQKLDYLILVDVVFAKAQHRSGKVESVKSEFISGYRTDPNPDYALAQAKVDAERANLAGVKIRNALNPCTFCGLGAAISHALGQGLAEAAAQARLNEAVQALRTASPISKAPIYQEYSFKRAFLESKKAVSINYYVIDLRKQTFSKHTFERHEKKQFQVVYQLHDKDRSGALHLQGAVTEKDISTWEQSPFTIKLSSILEHYLPESEKARRPISVELFEKQRQEEKNKVVAEKLANIPQSTPISDSRFEKVVVIHNRQKSSVGSGFFVRPDVVLTNYHVVQEATYVEMKMYGGEESFGKVMKYDARLDLALVKVQSRGKPVDFYNEPTVNLGSAVEAIGHPVGLEFSITRGVISVIRKQPSLIVPGTGEVLTVQTDTTLNIGNSGGPLFLGDKVVGVVSYAVRNPTLEGLNFAIHYTEVLRFLKENLTDR